MTTHSVRIPARVREHVLTSDAAARPGTDELADELIRAMCGHPVRKDGSQALALNADQRAVLAEYADALQDGARDNLGYDDEGRDALADLNAARACLRALTAVRNDA